MNKNVFFITDKCILSGLIMMAERVSSCFSRDKDPGCLPVSAMSNQTQETLERLCFSAGLGTARDSPGGAGGSVWASFLKLLTPRSGPR